MNIKDFGWNDFFENQLNKKDCENMFPARVVADFGQSVRVAAESGEILVNKPVHKSEQDMQAAVGDWVLLEATGGSAGNTTILMRRVLNRRTKFSRAAAGIEVKEQIVAANVDTVFLIQSLNRDFNMRRLERYLIAAWESGAVPVAVLTKADCCDNVADKMSIVYNAAPGVEIHAVSCISGAGLDGIKKYLGLDKTVALLGSSGVGKSTLANTLAGEELLKTGAIREDDSRGRHTTTHRELILLPGGGLILDTPGMRALSLWEADSGMEMMFGDIEELVSQCRFHDCRHQNEPGCAVRTALESETLERKRWESWIKLQKELAYLETKKDGRQRVQDKQQGRQFAKLQKETYKERW